MIKYDYDIIYKKWRWENDESYTDVKWTWIKRGRN